MREDNLKAQEKFEEAIRGISDEQVKNVLKWKWRKRQLNREISELEWEIKKIEDTLGEIEVSTIEELLDTYSSLSKRGKLVVKKRIKLLDLLREFGNVKDVLEKEEYRLKRQNPEAYDTYRKLCDTIIEEIEQ